MHLLLTGVAIVFVLLGVSLLYAFRRSKNLGVLLGAIVYLSAGVVALYLPSWWVIAAGFSATLLLRVVGLDPGAPPRSPNAMAHEYLREAGIPTGPVTDEDVRRTLEQIRRSEEEG